MTRNLSRPLLYPIPHHGAKRCYCYAKQNTSELRHAIATLGDTLLCFATPRLAIASQSHTQSYPNRHYAIVPVRETYHSQAIPLKHLE